MNNKRNRNLNVVSGISEELIDKATRTRIKYFNSTKKAKKKLAPIIAIAAAVAILMSVAMIVLVPMMTKQIPIYTGMTVTSADPQEVAKYGNVFKLSSLMPLDNENTEGNNGNHGSNNPNKKPIEDIVEDESSLQIMGGKVIYSAKPGEKVLVVIHFDNPDQFEIMSFTLNGKKYATQMFKDGSDMENLIVEYDIDENAEGIIDCTIDAIKYIDGTTIKDVKIGGEQTVQIGVYNKEQPTAQIENKNIGATDFSFDVTVNDPVGLIELTKGKVYAVLANEEKVISTKEITVGKKNNVRFERLPGEVYYRYGIVAYYDAFDGQGYTAHSLYEAPINLFSITYLMNGGYNSPSNPTEYWITQATKIENPTKAGYVFLGWTYKGQDTPQKNVTIPAGTNGDITLTAHWENVFTDMVLPVKNSGVRGIDYDAFGSGSKSGLTFFAPEGTEIQCILDGTVSHVDARGIIDIKLKTENSEITLVYLNLLNPGTLFTDKFQVGDKISKGTVIGKMLNNPLLLNDPLCVHFMVMMDGEEVDPLTCFPKEIAQELADTMSFKEYFKAEKGFNEVIEKVIFPSIADKDLSIVKGYSEDHRALDVTSKYFTEGVCSIADGVITSIWNDSEYGYSVAVKCGSVTMIYQNLKNQEIVGIQVGASVKTGAVIGYIGNTSTAEQGEGQLHLVFEYAPGLYIDPTK